MDDADFDLLIQAIGGDQAPRVWSLLVSVFGELAQDPSARISGAVLGQMTALIGIKPEAMRVALHRLRKDGWIKSQRAGRTSHYVLTPWGRAQCAQATPLIYQHSPHAATVWLVVGQPGNTLPEPQPGQTGTAISVGSGLWVVDRAANDPDILCFPLSESAGLPDWIRARITAPALVEAAETLAAQLTHLGKLIPPAARLSPIQIATLRVLVVHGWRRVVLRAPGLPDFVMPPEWRGSACRELVQDLLARLPKPPLEALDLAGAKPVR